VLWVPQTDGLVAESDTLLGEQVFYIPATEIEAVVETDGIADEL